MILDYVLTVNSSEFTNQSGVILTLNQQKLWEVGERRQASPDLFSSVGALSHLFFKMLFILYITRKALFSPHYCI